MRLRATKGRHIVSPYTYSYTLLKHTTCQQRNRRDQDFRNSHLQASLCHTLLHNSRNMCRLFPLSLQTLRLFKIPSSYTAMDAYVLCLQPFFPKGKRFVWTRDTRTLSFCAALAIDGYAMTISHARCELVWLLPWSQPLILHCSSER